MSCDGVGAGGSWSSAVDRGAQAICGWDEMCDANSDGMSLTACLDDVRTNLDAVRTMVVNEANCIHCLEVTADELERAIFASCAPPPDAVKIIAACGANNEACAGAP